MFQEEALVIEYLAKISELILQMRYDHHMLASASAGGNLVIGNKSSTPSSNSKFGFTLQKQQYKMENQITDKWNSSFTAITLEFFLQRKSDASSRCVEQWQFCYEKEFAHPSHIRRQGGAANKAVLADSSQKTNKKSSADLKLTGLSRSIFVLLINSPLWRHYISSENRGVKNSFILDYKISFAKNQPISNSTSIPTQQLPLSSGTLTFSCFYLNDFEKLIEKTTPASTQSQSPNLNSISTANSSPHTILSNNNINNNNNTHTQISNKKKYERERFLSEKINPSDLLLDQLAPSPISSSTMEKPIIKQNDNMTFKFSFSDTEPLSDEEKKIINHHLRKSSVVSVYSRKDDITIVSTPEEIALKMSDGMESELNGFEIEMVLEERGNQQPQRALLQVNNNYFNLDAPNSKQTTRQKANAIYSPIIAPIIIEDDFDFQLIEEENDRPIDSAIKRLSNLINTHKTQLKNLKPTKTAFDLFQSLNQQVKTF